MRFFFTTFIFIFFSISNLEAAQAPRTSLGIENIKLPVVDTTGLYEDIEENVNPKIDNYDTYFVNFYNTNLSNLEKEGLYLGRITKKFDNSIINFLSIIIAVEKNKKFGFLTILIQTDKDEDLLAYPFLTKIAPNYVPKNKLEMTLHYEDSDLSMFVSGVRKTDLSMIFNVKINDSVVFIENLTLELMN